MIYSKELVSPALKNGVSTVSPELVKILLLLSSYIPLKYVTEFVCLEFPLFCAC